MEPTIVSNQVRKTSDYNQFVILEANRDATRGHVEALKAAFEEVGNLTAVQPILVNEKFEIIDGQHRFIAARELDEPIYYTIAPALGIAEARSMNILHRSWSTYDFAESYASEGNPNYRKYLQLKEEYRLNHVTMITYAEGQEKTGLLAQFRKGDFVIKNLDEWQTRLEMLYSVRDFAPMYRDMYFSRAFLWMIQNPEYSHKHMLAKLSLWGEQILRRMGSVQEYSRLLEEIYNYKMTGKNRTRLF